MKILFCLLFLDKKKISIKRAVFVVIWKKSLFQNFLLMEKLFKRYKRRKKVGIILNEAEKIWAENNFDLSSKDFETIIKKILFQIKYNLLLKFQNFFPQMEFQH